jgi:membrane protease YdiL (CAAX protease family)
VLSFAFGGAVIVSTWDWWTGTVVVFTSRAFVGGIWHVVLDLALLAYVLNRRQRSFRDLGLSWRWIDIPAGLLLFIAEAFASVASHRVLNWISVLVIDHPLTSHGFQEHLAGTALITLQMMYSVAAPVGEEMIVRAYAMTEIEALTGKVSVAVAASVGLQTFYHLYQGIPAALNHAAGFLILALFYARFRRILPVILAHVMWDLVATANML